MLPSTSPAGCDLGFALAGFSDIDRCMLGNSEESTSRAADAPRLNGRFSFSAGDVGREFMGYEKFTEPRLPGRSISGTVLKLLIRLCGAE